ncbi:hypothetical protein BTI50_04920 [Lactobacillus delbrueckii subsp. bulgaricus]|nr:hypothetical protein [Lactobacillus delbrueckii subsp. bulgaricus]MBT8897054.1 hypothetical protein [Lactobacillus delbrueckii subsp. bulgaricus]MBT8902944.1 hypothetical protein [Lactobacillus delbrueckii subsp. bulgaricus]MBT8910681.1 hypothetical protein [Lactobacillus delbrueckii subsp. bulgaricus]MBT8916903.1 hypothetical protein [Lactobacillus delbrueckii subsp. bulgaricus]
MWLANDLLLTAAAVSLIINLVGQTASGYAFSGSHGQATELLYDAFILLVAAAALGSKWLAPAAAWVIIDRVVGLYFGLTWYWTLAVVALEVSLVLASYRWRGKAVSNYWLAGILLAVSLVSCVMAWLG